MSRSATYRFAMAAALVLASLWGGLSEASAAASRVCARLEADLASLSGAGRPSRQTRRYDEAIDRQREQMAVARRQARQAGCGFLSLGGGSRECGMIQATLRRMQRNLDSLESRRGSIGGGGVRRSRFQILAALEDNGCRSSEIAARRPPAQMKDDLRRKKRAEDREKAAVAARTQPRDAERRDIAKRSKAEERRDARKRTEEPEQDRPAPRDVARVSEIPVPAFAGYRTVCVRICDGYFFPMSGSVGLGDFGRDQKRCEAACPGTALQVYYSDPAKPDAADLVSAQSGKPYSDLPTAFLHQNMSAPRPAGCGCSAARTFEVIAGEPPAERSAAIVETAGTVPADAFDVPLPTPRPDAALVAAQPLAAPQEPAPTDPEPGSTAFITPEPKDSMSSGSIVTLDPPASLRAPAPAAPLPMTPKPDTPLEERKVRVVGPEFLPDPKGAIDLTAPAPTAVP